MDLGYPARKALRYSDSPPRDGRKFFRGKLGNCSISHRSGSGLHRESRLKAGKLARAAKFHRHGQQHLSQGYATPWVRSLRRTGQRIGTEGGFLGLRRLQYKYILQSCSFACRRGGSISIRQVWLIPSKWQGTIEGDEHVFFKNAALVNRRPTTLIARSYDSQYNI